MQSVRDGLPVMSDWTTAGVLMPLQFSASPPLWSSRLDDPAMPDVYSAATRSYVMSRIRKRDTKAEVLLRKRLWASGLRGYRTHVALPGRPDIVWTRVRLALFVDGCFWHGCPSCRIPKPASRKE